MAKSLKTSKKPTKRWTKEETKMFLEYYIARKDEFLNTRKKRLAYTKILEDLKSAGFDPKTKVSHLEVKIQTLLRTYKAFVENPNEIVPPFMSQMEEIFAHKELHNYKGEFTTGTTQSGASDNDNSSAEAPYTENILAYCKTEQFEEETNNSTPTSHQQHTFNKRKLSEIDPQLMPESKKVYSSPPEEIIIDSDKMFLLSLLPSVSQLTPAENMDFRLYVQQFLKDRLFPSTTSEDHSDPFPTTTSENDHQGI